MATIRLVPSTYSVSNSSYVSVSSASNMYTNTDSTSYATLTHSNKSTTTYYVYVTGFDFDSIPSDAVITSFRVLVKGYESRINTSTSYAPSLCNNTSSISGTTASDSFSSSTDILELPSGSLTWSQIVGYDSNFGVMIPLRRSNKNQQCYIYIYGIELEVTYAIAAQDAVHAKINNSWVELDVKTVWKNINGSWVEQTDLSNVFDSGTNYRYG